MKQKFIASTIALLLSIAAFATGQPTTQPERTRGPRGQRDPSMMPQNVEGAMKGANRAMRTLKRQLADASKKDENLKLIGDMQRNLVIAKSMPLPDDIREDVKGDDRIKLQESYRADLIAVVRKLLDLEQSVIDGKLDDAQKQFAEVQQMRDSAHDKLGVKDDDKGR